jgi:uncharacterized protein YjdB
VKALLQEVSVVPSSSTLYVNGNTKKTKKLSVSLPDSLKGAVITYQSGRPSVASVSKNGKITAKKAGKAIITTVVSCYGNSIFLSTTITVKAASIKLTKSKTSMKAGTAFTFKASGNGVSTSSLRYSSSNKKVLSVNAKTGKAAAKKKGTAVITVQSGKVKKSVKVTVK